MGTYYQFSIVHGRVLLWWTDMDGLHHERWVDGDAASAFIVVADNSDMAVQSALQRLAAQSST